MNVNEIAGLALFTAWTVLIILGMIPSLGARVGLWLRSPFEPAPPPLPTKNDEVEQKTKEGKLDIWV